MPILLQIPENPNCDPMDAQVFQCRSAARDVTHIWCEHAGQPDWWVVSGIDEGGAVCPATACLVEDSGDGACYLVIGGEWGLRLKPAAGAGDFDLSDSLQWGAPYFLLSGHGETLRFAPDRG